MNIKNVIACAIILPVLAACGPTVHRTSVQAFKWAEVACGSLGFDKVEKVEEIKDIHANNNIERHEVIAYCGLGISIKIDVLENAKKIPEKKNV